MSARQGARERAVVDRVQPRQQTDWDIRGALNFILGGPGGGMLAAAPMARAYGIDARPIAFVGLALVGAGLFSVWLKIGRPWRALYVFRRPSMSWMSREAIIAALLAPAGMAAVLTDRTVFYALAGALGLAHVYAQARILRANIGIPAWRGAACQHLVVLTGLAEGGALVSLVAAFTPAARPFAYVLALLVAARFVAWRRYIAALRGKGAPSGALRALGALEPGFVWAGHAAPCALALAGGLGAPPPALVFAGALAAASGAWLKYVLVLRAAFTQGFALPRMPSRGRSAPGAGLQPGWTPPGGDARSAAGEIGLDQIHRG